MRIEDDLTDELVNLVLSRNLAAIRQRAAWAGVHAHELLGTLVRSCIRPPDGMGLMSADYGAVEARAVLYMAADDAGLDIFRLADRGKGPDAYRVQASALLGISPMDVSKVQRQLGKSLVLGCGFGMGSKRFAQQASLEGVDWNAVAITPLEAVEAWRDKYPLVAGWRSGEYEGRPSRTGGLWKDLEAAALTAASGGIAEVHGLRWERRSADVICRLPSGRELVYRKARITTDANRPRKKQFAYLGHRKNLVTAWGGTLTENVVQAFCRDLLADALVRLERAGIRSVLHVHDEIVAEVPGDPNRAEEARREIVTLMETAPPWAHGFPIAVEATLMRRYRK
jgi:DNA polymerase